MAEGQMTKGPLWNQKHSCLLHA